jgi:5-methylcytosine-specific restriction endonuclease McrA
MSVSCLTDPTLVLNKHWLPIRVCTVRRALTLVFKDLARIISPENYAVHDFKSWSDLRHEGNFSTIHTVALTIRVPEIIVLRGFDRFTRPQVVFSRRNLFRRDRNACQYCGQRFPTEDLSIDHVVPRAQGGVSNWTNCVVACLECNARKGARSLDQAGMRLIRQPRKPTPQMAFSLPLGTRKASWDHFVSEVYWNTELEA